MKSILSTTRFTRLCRWAILAGAVASAVPGSTQDDGANQLIVFYKTGSMPIQGYQPCGLIELDRSGPAVLYAANSGAHAMEAMRAAGASPRVSQICPNEWIAIQPRQFAPNDPLFAPGSGHSGQWSLFNALNMPHANLIPAWLSGATGQGVNIGIVDDGLDYTHPDLRPNYNPLLSFDYAQNDANPMPLSGDLHGTMMAGVVAARGGNGLGLTGVAPMASLVGIRIGRSQPTDMWRVVKAMRHQAEAVTIKVHGYGLNNSSSAAQPYMSFTSASTAQSETADVGVIHVRSAGNERDKATEDANKWDLENDPSAICVSAVGADGKFAPYSSFGANLLISAPGGWSSGSNRITSTATQGSGNLGGVYTNQFYGTSSSAALVAGVLALGKEVQPEMDVRMAKHLLIMSAQPIDTGDGTPSSDGGWRENGAGLPFNPNYGHGLVDAAAFVELARSAGELSELETESTFGTPNAVIPDNNANGIQRRFTIESETPLEDVVIKLKFTHQRRGDLEAYLTSPSGFKSRLFTTSALDSRANLNWTFSSTAFWGENPAGEWTLTVCDRRAQKTGKLDRFDVTMRMGTLDASSGPEAPSDLTPTPYVDSVDLEWTDNSEDEEGFTVYGSEDGIDYEVVQHVAADETNCTVGGLRPDTAYWFMVKAHNGEGASNPSNIAETRTLQLPAPILSIDDTTVRTLSCSWTFDGEADHYEVQCVELGEPEESEAAEKLYEGLAPESTYTIRVRAIVGEGETAYASPWSEDVQGTTLPLSAPEDLETEATTTSIEATWSEVDECDGYETQIDEGDIEETTDTSFEFVGLEPETTYTIRVRAFIEVDGERHVSEWSEVEETTDSSFVEAPTDLQAIHIGSTSVTLEWQDNSDNETKFRIAKSVNGSNFDNAGEVGEDETQFTVEGLLPATTYYFKVRAGSETQFSEYSNTITVRTKPAAPSGFRVTGIGRYFVSVAWSYGAHPDRFEIEQSISGGGWHLGENVPPDVRAARRDPLSASTDYRFRIRAIVNGTPSAWSDPVSARTPDVPPAPPAPGNFRVTDIGRYFVGLAWSYSSDPDRFELEQSINGGGWHLGENVPGSVRSARRDPLSASTDYRFRIRAIVNGAPTPWSEIVSARTPDTPPLVPPTNLRVRDKGREWVRLDWDHPGGAVHFEIQQRRQDSGGWTEWRHGENVPGNLRSAQRDGLRANALYRFRIRAHYNHGVSDWSNTVEVRTRQ